MMAQVWLPANTGGVVMVNNITAAQNTALSLPTRFTLTDGLSLLTPIVFKATVSSLFAQPLHYFERIPSFWRGLKTSQPALFLQHHNPRTAKQYFQFPLHHASLSVRTPSS